MLRVPGPPDIVGAVVTRDVDWSSMAVMVPAMLPPPPDVDRRT